MSVHTRFMIMKVERMSNKKNLYQYDYFELYQLIEEHGSGRKAAAFLEVARTTFQDRYAELKAAAFSDRIIVNPIKIELDEPVKRFIFTSAQDGTSVHEPFLVNLLEYAEFLDAELMVAGFTYNKKLFEDHSKYTASFNEKIRPYLMNDRLEIGGRVVFCGEMNTLPTAVNPLSGFETYTGAKWGIFPHAKVQLQSIPTMKETLSKVIMTTGAITLPNYVPKKAGIKAEYHHIQSAVLLEIMQDGTFFCRHLMAEKDGSFQDLDIKVSNGKLKFHQTIEGITHGDIHLEVIDHAIEKVVWEGKESIVDTLKPKFQFFEDTTDFRERNHHRIMDPHHMYEMFIHGIDSIETSFTEVAKFLNKTQRNFSESIIVESNHDLAFERWLKTADYRYDPVNAELFLKSQLACYNAIKEGDKRFSIFEHTVCRLAREKNIPIGAVQFLREDDSFLICPDDGKGGIECGLHGHVGGDGARGTVRQFTKFGPRMNTAHIHKASIIDGVYSAGTYSQLDLGWNRGPSSWNHSLIVTYPSSKRGIVTIQNGLWRAPL